MLPEIVEQMEKAQDKVIRASPKGSFLIAGPAGSGKTTLALHRVAYLLQSPDTAEKYKESSSIVFVQDQSTRDYFSQLLPQLGVNGVTITTFADWVRMQLKLQDTQFVFRFSNFEPEQDLYEYEKYLALRNSPKKINYTINTFELLEKTYSKYFSKFSIKLFQKQKRSKALDRFDLTALLASYIETHNGIFDEETELKQLPGGKVQRKKKQIPIEFSLIILDEVQNYLPEQIRLLKMCASKKDSSVIYVGDLAQQTLLNTLQTWGQANEEFTEDKKVILQKNYRSTRQIIEYINSVGFSMSIPLGLKNGPNVVETIVKSAEEELELVKKVVSENPHTTTIGILAKSRDYLDNYYFSLQQNSASNVHFLTINESQGVEFDIVCIVGINADLFLINLAHPQALQEERRRINNDLLYVALTRPINQLYIFGLTTVRNIIKLP